LFVGWERRWEDVNLFGGFVDGGMESRRVVEVPSDSIASPGRERAITLAGLSPAKGAIRHSVSNGTSGQEKRLTKNREQIYEPGWKPHLLFQ
jgi:hypothetical protein